MYMSPLTCYKKCVFACSKTTRKYSKLCTLVQKCEKCRREEKTQGLE